MTQANITRILKAAGFAQSERIQTAKNRKGSQRGHWHTTEGFRVENIASQGIVFAVHTQMDSAVRPEDWPDPDAARPRVIEYLEALRKAGLPARIEQRSHHYRPYVVVDTREAP